VLVYVHGSGHQDPPDVLRERLDRILFGEARETSRLAYYAHVLHADKPQTILGRLRAAAPHRRAERELAEAVTNARTSVAETVAAAVAHPTTVELDALEDLAPDDHARSRIRALRARIQRHEDRAISDRPHWLEREAFRVLLATLLPDVGAYFFGGRSEEMREPLRAVLRTVDGPITLVTHSLGTVISYHVLQEPEFATIDVEHWITLGSPLGIDEVRWLATRGLAHPAPVPATVRRWTNIADPLDPVALDGTLRDEFGPAERIADLQVSILCRSHHAMKAYLATDHVRATVLEALSRSTPGHQVAGTGDGARRRPERRETHR
jgi:hypothetical protein